MTAVRALLVLVTSVFVTAAATAFAVQETLTQPAAFAASMDAALDTAPVRSEVQAEVRQEVLEALDRAPAAVRAITTFVGPEVLADQAAAAVDTQVFRRAWHDWSLLVFTGLRDRAQGTPNGDVTVSRGTVTVAVAPLITPILGETAAGGVAVALDLFDADTTVTLDAGFPVGPVLTAIGRLAEWRWWLVAGAVGGLLLLVANRRGLLWLALAAMGSGLGCALVAGAVGLAQARPVAGAEFPQLGLAVTNALSTSWDLTLVRVALMCAAVAVVAFLLDAVTSRRRRPVRTA